MSNKGGRVSPDYLADIAPEYAAERENPTHDEHSQQQEYMTRKEVMTLLKRCDSTMTKWAKRGYLVPCCVGGKYLYRKSDVMKLVGK